MRIEICKYKPFIRKETRNKYACNYRPLSLIGVPCKLLVYTIRDNTVELNKLFSDKQFGFIFGKSTVLQLICVRNTR